MEPPNEAVPKRVAQTIPVGTQASDLEGTKPQADPTSPAGRQANTLEPREATELEQMHHVAAQGEARIVRSDKTLERHSHPSRSGHFALWHLIVTFWSRQVSIVTPHESCRDHFANERTYLGYLRTSLAFAIQGTLIAQLFRLQHTSSPSPSLGFFVLGIPLACLCIAFAICIATLGAFRFWRQQNAMARGKCHAGGWEVYAVGVLGLLATTAIFSLILAVNIEKELLHPGLRRSES